MLKRGAFLLLGYAGTALILYLLFTAQQPPTPAFHTVCIVLFFLMLPGLLRLTITLLVAPWNDPIQRRRDRRRSAAKRGAAYAPLMSVIVPAWNEEVGIRSP